LFPLTSFFIHLSGHGKGLGQGASLRRPALRCSFLSVTTYTQFAMRLLQDLSNKRSAMDASRKTFALNSVSTRPRSLDPANDLLLPWNPLYTAGCQENVFPPLNSAGVLSLSYCRIL
jgi:hypothetical protein